MGFNIRKIDDLLNYMEIFQEPGIILNIDFEKSFDTVEWESIYTALKMFNFGDIFINYNKTIYKDIESCVCNNRNISKWFKPSRGVRQGCPLSPYLFINLSEVLAKEIRDNKAISGIIINDTELKLNQLADDAAVFVSNVKSVKETLKVFEKYYKYCGLKVNLDKTQAIPFGPLKHLHKSNLYGLNWSCPFVESLGITFTNNEIDNYNYNFKP